MQYDIQWAMALASEYFDGKQDRETLAGIFDFAHPLFFEKGQTSLAIQKPSFCSAELCAAIIWISQR